MANTISTQINPALFGELDVVHVVSVTVDGSGAVTGTGPAVRVAPRPPAGTVVKVRDYATTEEKGSTTLTAQGYLADPYDMGDSKAVEFSVDNWTTVLGPFFSPQALWDAITRDAGSSAVQRSLLSTKGALAVGTGTTDPDGTAVVMRLPVGANGAVLVADTAAAGGVKWATGVALGTYERWLEEGNTGTVADFLIAMRGAQGPAGTPGVNPPPFIREGNLVVGTGSFRWYNDTGLGLTITSIRATVGTAPVGASVIVDVNKNGSTLFTTASNRPTIPVGTAKTSGKVTSMNVTTMADGDYLTVDVDQVGSTTPGADLGVFINLRPTV